MCFQRHGGKGKGKGGRRYRYNSYGYDTRPIPGCDGIGDTYGTVRDTNDDDAELLTPSIRIIVCLPRPLLHLRLPVVLAAVTTIIRARMVWFVGTITTTTARRRRFLVALTRSS